MDKGELRQIEQSTWKLMTMHNALHARDDMDGIYVPRKERRGLANIEDCIDATIRGLDKFSKKDYLQLPLAAIST